MQYTYYVPHQIEELISMVGEDEFNERLNKSFEISRENIFGGGQTIDAFAGLHTMYNHGNQPNLHISWLFNFSGKPWLSQKWVRAICDEFYGGYSWLWIWSGRRSGPVGCMVIRL